MASMITIRKLKTKVKKYISDARMSDTKPWPFA